MRLLHCLTGVPLPGRPPTLVVRPRPPAGQAHVVADHVLACVGKASNLVCHRENSSCILGAPWWGCYRSRAPVPVPTDLSYPWYCLGGDAVRRLSPPSSLPSLPCGSRESCCACCSGCPLSPCCFCLLWFLPPYPTVPNHASVITASAASTDVVKYVKLLCSAGGTTPPLYPNPASCGNVGCQIPSAQLLRSV